MQQCQEPVSEWLVDQYDCYCKKNKKDSKVLHYTPLWLMCFTIMKSTVLTQQALKGKTGGGTGREGKYPGRTRATGQP